METPLDRAIRATNGVTALASSIGVGQSVVSNWRARGNVPAEHCPAIERVTRAVAEEKSDPSLVVTCEQLQPDVEWSVLRDHARAA